MDDARLAALRATKLVALVGSVRGVDSSTVAKPSGESSLVATSYDGRTYALADRLGDLGPILRWALSRADRGVTVFADVDAGRGSNTAGHLARRAGLLNADVEVLAVTGAATDPAAPLPLPLPPTLSDSAWRLAAVMADAGARVVDDHGRLTGEVDGLEAARVEEAPGDVDPVLQIGIGAADRELGRSVHGHLDDAERLQHVIATIRQHRRPGSALHPLSRLARPRWVRSMLFSNPDAIGLSVLEPRPPLESFPGVFDGQPAAAYAPSDRATVVCSAGVDLDLIPTAVDLRHRIDPDSRLVVVLPGRDAELATRGMTDLADNVEITAVVPPWDQSPG